MEWDQASYCCVFSKDFCLIKFLGYWKATSQSQGEGSPSNRKPSSKAKSKSQATATQIIDSDDESEPKFSLRGKRRAASNQPVSQSQKRTQTQKRGGTRRKDAQLFLDSEEENEREVGVNEGGDDDVEMISEDVASTIKSSAEAREEPGPSAKPARKKRAPAAIPDDDSDTGVTFKGFDSRKKRKL